MVSTCTSDLLVKLWHQQLLIPTVMSILVHSSASVPFDRQVKIGTIKYWLQLCNSMTSRMSKTWSVWCPQHVVIYWTHMWHKNEMTGTEFLWPYIYAFLRHQQQTQHKSVDWRKNRPKMHQARWRHRVFTHLHSLLYNSSKISFELMFFMDSEKLEKKPW